MKIKFFQLYRKLVTYGQQEFHYEIQDVIETKLVLVFSSLIFTYFGM